METKLIVYCNVNYLDKWPDVSYFMVSYEPDYVGREYEYYLITPGTGTDGLIPFSSREDAKVFLKDKGLSFDAVMRPINNRVFRKYRLIDPRDLPKRLTVTRAEKVTIDLNKTTYRPGCYSMIYHDAIDAARHQIINDMASKGYIIAFIKIKVIQVKTIL